MGTHKTSSVVHNDHTAGTSEQQIEDHAANAGAAEMLEESYRTLPEEDGEDEPPEKYKMCARKQLLCRDIKKQICSYTQK